MFFLFSWGKKGKSEKKMLDKSSPKEYQEGEKTGKEKLKLKNKYETKTSIHALREQA